MFDLENDTPFEWLSVRPLAKKVVKGPRLDGVWGPRSTVRRLTRTRGADRGSGLDAAVLARRRGLEGLQRLQHVLDPGDLGVDVLAPAHQDLQLTLSLLDRAPGLADRLRLELLATLERNWQMSWLDGADHSFHVLKSSGRTDAQVLDQVAAACDAWIAESVTGR